MELAFTTKFGPGGRFSKAPETWLFGFVKPFLDHLYLKMEKCIRLELLVWRVPFIFRIWGENNSVIARFEILQWLYGPEKFRGFRETAPSGPFLERPSKLSGAVSHPVSPRKLFGCCSKLPIFSIPLFLSVACPVFSGPFKKQAPGDDSFGRLECEICHA